VGDAPDGDGAAGAALDGDEQQHVDPAEIEAAPIELDQIGDAPEARAHEDLAEIEDDLLGGDVGDPELFGDAAAIEVEIAAGQPPEEREPALDRDLAGEGRPRADPDEAAAARADERSG